MSVNKVILVGRLGSDPEMKSTQSGSAVANLRIATSEYRTDQQGNRQEQTEWHRVVAFGKTAELCGKYLSKGRQVYLEGKIQTRQWTDQQGQTRYTTEVIAREVTFLGERTGNAGASPGGYTQNQGGWGQSAPASPAAPAPFDSGPLGGGGGGFNDDDIPF